MPAILAIEERCHSSGKEILIAYVVGFEVGVKLGTAIGQSHYARGWHNTRTLRSIASAQKREIIIPLALQVEDCLVYVESYVKAKNKEIENKNLVSKWDIT